MSHKIVNSGNRAMLCSRKVPVELPELPIIITFSVLFLYVKLVGYPTSKL